MMGLFSVRACLSALSAMGSNKKCCGLSQKMLRNLRVTNRRSHQCSSMIYITVCTIIAVRCVHVPTRATRAHKKHKNKSHN